MSSRITSVDTVRTVAIFAVIVGHNPDFFVFPNPVNFVIGQLLRFAVPYFMVVAGYFWAQRVSDPALMGPMSRAQAFRIALLFLGWSLIYLLPTHMETALSLGPWGPVQLLVSNVRAAASDPLGFLLHSNETHLWFMSSLAIAIAVCGILLRYGLDKPLVALAVGLYLLGVAGHAYNHTPLGLSTSFDFSDGPWPTLLFFVSGYYLQRAQNRQQWFSMGATLAISGFFLQCTEVATIKLAWDGPKFPDYTLGTYPMGVGVAMMALTGSRFLSVRPLAWFGPYIFGIYVVHMIFSNMLGPYFDLTSPSAIYYFSFILLIFALSFATSYLMSTNPIARSLILLRRSERPAVASALHS